MDAAGFDRIARTLTSASSRRATLGLALAGLLGMAAPNSEAKRKKGKKKKKKCRGCETCEQCVKGKCKPKPNGAACGGKCNECQGGVCAVKDDGSSCGPCGTCHFGACGPHPVGTACGAGKACTANQDCATVCAQSDPGNVCVSDAGCHCSGNSSVEGAYYCESTRTAPIPDVSECESSEECGAGRFCQGCQSGGIKCCFDLCTP